uniref:Uncharacterized protein n=1 Tax=Bombyx mori TaxID=7091 RepID=A0A8R2ATX3_BOMMO|nr:uncharacterized protein LOC101735328 [Bombyx mori]
MKRVLNVPSFVLFNGHKIMLIRVRCIPIFAYSEGSYLVKILILSNLVSGCNIAQSLILLLLGYTAGEARTHLVEESMLLVKTTYHGSPGHGHFTQKSKSIVRLILVRFCRSSLMTYPDVMPLASAAYGWVAV